MWYMAGLADSVIRTGSLSHDSAEPERCLHKVCACQSARVTSVNESFVGVS